MESSCERACPSCAAPAQAAQRWCLECGAELPLARRTGLRPAIGIATALAVLVGAASAGGYSLLQTGKPLPPPPTTVAQAPPAPTPAPATQEPSSVPSYSYPPPAPLPSAPRPLTPSPGTTGGASVPTTTPQTTPSTSHDAGGATTPAPPPKPETALVNVALGKAAVVYAPYTAPEVDLGDATRVVDAAKRTAWKTPPGADPATPPQIGVYVDLEARTRLRRLVLESPTPGMKVEIYGALKGPPEQITDAGWDHIATLADVFQETRLRMPKRPFRYVLVWITALPPNADRAAISELSLFSVQPE
jgi:hypothetical protein